MCVLTATGGTGSPKTWVEIRKQLNEQGYTTPLVADIHFNPRAADAAAGEVEKVTYLSPGNYVDKVKTFSHLEYTE